MQIKILKGFEESLFYVGTLLCEQHHYPFYALLSVLQQEGTKSRNVSVLTLHESTVKSKMCLKYYNSNYTGYENSAYDK